MFVGVLALSSSASCIDDVLWNSGSRLVLWYRVVPVEVLTFQVVYKCRMYVENRISDFLMVTLFRSLSEDGTPSEKFFTVSSVFCKVVTLFLEDMYSMFFILTSLLLQLFQGSAFKKRREVCVCVCVCVVKKLKAFKK
jgi:hypothetical protein